MILSSLLYPATVRAHVQLDSKKALFPFVGDLASRSLGLDAGAVCDGWLARVRNGSTGFDLGIELPHTKKADLSGLRRLSPPLPRSSVVNHVDDLDLLVRVLLTATLAAT